MRTKLTKGTKKKGTLNAFVIFVAFVIIVVGRWPSP
jgi:hypothetical protein